jgi:hypothetical protein
MKLFGFFAIESPRREVFVNEPRARGLKVSQAGARVFTGRIDIKRFHSESFGGEPLCRFDP